MAYEAYEAIAGTSVIRSVEMHCRHLTNGGTFGTASTPTLTLVEQWIDESYYTIQAHLAMEGFSTAVSTALTAVTGFLQRLNVFGAVVQVELSHPITGMRGEENDRYKEYRRLWDKGITTIASDALDNLGLDRDVAVSAYISVGGTSIDEKDTLYDDVDAVQSRFRTGFGRDPRVGRIIDRSQGGAEEV